MMFLPVAAALLVGFPGDVQFMGVRLERSSFEDAFAILGRSALTLSSVGADRIKYACYLDREGRLLVLTSVALEGYEVVNGVALGESAEVDVGLGRIDASTCSRSKQQFTHPLLETHIGASKAEVLRSMRAMHARATRVNEYLKTARLKKEGDVWDVQLWVRVGFRRNRLTAIWVSQTTTN